MNTMLLKILGFIRKKKILIIFSLFIFWIVSYLFLPLNVTEENASFEVVDGSNLNEITEQLVEVNVLRDSFRFKLLTSVFAKRESLKRGHYKLEANATALDLLDMLAEGRESLYSIYFVCCQSNEQKNQKNLLIYGVNYMVVLLLNFIIINIYIIFLNPIV